MLVEIYEAPHCLYEYGISVIGDVNIIRDYITKKWKNQRISKYDGNNLITDMHINEYLEELLKGNDVEINDDNRLLLLTYDQLSSEINNVTGEYFITSSCPGGGFDVINCTSYEEAIKQYNIMCKPDDMDSDGEFNYCISLFRTDGTSMITELMNELVEFN